MVHALLTWEGMHRGWECRMPPGGVQEQGTLCMSNKGKEEGRMIRAVVAPAGYAACYLLLLPGAFLPCFQSILMPGKNHLKQVDGQQVHNQFSYKRNAYLVLQVH